MYVCVCVKGDVTLIFFSVHGVIFVYLERLLLGSHISLDIRLDILFSMRSLYKGVTINMFLIQVS